MGQKTFGAFVMTYERPQVIMDSLLKILAQTFPPEYLLVIDNSSSKGTKAIVEEMEDERIGYHWMGYNSGPAGAARFGLQKLNELGYEWIYWGDDDDPPNDPHIFEHFFKNIEELENSGMALGVFGGKGGDLDRNTGRVRSLSNKDLSGKKFREVDVVPGGHTLLVNSEVVKQGVLPNKELFFGFEELDFCLRVKDNGFKVIIDAESWLNLRIAAKNSDENYQWRDSSFGNLDQLSRDYYSGRNLLVILFSQKYYRALCYRLFIMNLKSIAGYKFGWRFGTHNMVLQWKAIFHFLFRRFPKRESL